MKPNIKIPVLLAFSAILWSQGGAQAQVPKVLTLQQAIDMGMQNNHSLKMSETRTQLAEAKLQQVKDKSLPQIGTSVEYARLYVLSDFAMYMGGEKPAFALPTSHFDAMIGMTSAKKEIFGGFAERAAHQTNENLVAASKLDAERDYNELKYNIIALYYNIYKIKKSEQILDNNLLLLSHKETEVNNLLKEGVVTSNEVLKIQLQKSNLQLAKVDVRNAYAVAINNLSILLGIAEEESIAIDTLLQLKYPVTALPESELAATAAVSRPEIKSMQYQTKAAEGGYKQLQSAMYPHLDVSAMHIYLNPVVEHEFIPPKTEFMNGLNLGVSLKYNISSLYGLKGKKQEARLTIQQAKNATQLVQDKVRQEVYSQYKSYQSAIEKIHVSEVALQQADRSFQLTDSKFRNGLLLSTDLLEAQNLLQQAQLNLLQAQVDAQVAYARLEKATGTTL